MSWPKRPFNKSSKLEDGKENHFGQTKEQAAAGGKAAAIAFVTNRLSEMIQMGVVINRSNSSFRVDLQCFALRAIPEGKQQSA
jgi:hypothetical protein